MDVKSRKAGQLQTLVVLIERLSRDALGLADSDDAFWRVAEPLRGAAPYIQEAHREAGELGRD